MTVKITQEIELVCSGCHSLLKGELGSVNVIRVRPCTCQKVDELKAYADKFRNFEKKQIERFKEILGE
jgi:hypothetical protein